MADFFGGRLLRWLTLPYRVGGRRGRRVINVASRPFYQMADRILGSQFLQDIAEFFLNFQSMYDGFVDAGARRSSGCCTIARTTFAVVTTLEAAPLHEAEQLLRPSSTRRDFHLGALVLNRTLPDSLLSTRGRAGGDALHRRRAGARRELAAQPGDRRARRSGTNRARAAHGRRVVPELLARREARGRAAGRADASARGRRARAVVRRRDHRRRRARRAVGGYLFGDGRRDARSPIALEPHRRCTGAQLDARAHGSSRSWRPLADLSFSDLLLLAPIAEEAGHRFVVLAQVRPTTGQTIYPTDLVGTVVDEVERPILDAVAAHGRDRRERHAGVRHEGTGAGAVHPRALRRRRRSGSSRAICR